MLEGLRSSDDFRVLIVGLGSIGARHLRNSRLVCPGAKIAVLRRPDSDFIDPQSVGADCFLYRFSDVEDFAPHAAIIATPAPFHYVAATEIARLGVPLLVEKPLVADVDDASALVELCSSSSVTLAVGYNLRFLPSLRAAREKIIRGAIGEVFFVRAEVGQYLPDWRRGMDYRQGVSAQSRLGGGVLLELSHEIDYLLWMFGLPARVSAVGGRSGQLDCDVEDIVELTLQYERPWRLVSIHLDMLQRRPFRRCRAVGTRGSVEWDALADTVRVDGLQDSGAHFLDGVALTDKNDMYIEELRDFFTAAATGGTPVCGGEDGLCALVVIDAARRSLADAGRAVDLRTELLP